MEFKKLNNLQKLLLKLQDREAYKNYKFIAGLQGTSLPVTDVSSITDVHFKHSGHAGDIIYALPAMYALSKGKNIHLHLHTNQTVKYHSMQHPLGNIMLNEKLVTMLQPLLLHQPQIKTCDVYNNQPVTIDLDHFRQYPFNYKYGSIPRWYFLVFAINADLGRQWLQADSDTSVTDAIVIARSLRYRSPGISYNFLNNYPRKIFVGVEEEYLDMKKVIPSLEFRPVKDFLEMAAIIAGCNFFIGNQSFPFSLAEALKVQRLLEVYPHSPNVIVEGAEGYDFCYQPQFEKLVAHLYNKPR